MNRPVLTEEELQRCEEKNSNGQLRYSLAKKLIDSYRSILADNTDLIVRNDLFVKGMIEFHDLIFCDLSVPIKIREKFYCILLVDCNLDPNRDRGKDN